MATSSSFIITQLAFCLVVSWFFAAAAIRRLRSNNKKQADLIRELKQSRGKVESVKLKKRYKPLDSKKSGNEPEAITPALNDLDDEFKQGSDDTSELDAMLKAQSNSIKRLQAMSKALDGQNKVADANALNLEVLALKEKNQHSQRIVAKLTAQLKNKHSRMKSVQQQVTQLRASVGMMNGLERDNKRLSVDKSAMERKIKAEMFKHQQAIERIQGRLSVAEDRSRQEVNKASAREKTLLNTIVKLQEKLQTEPDDTGNKDNIRTLKNELTHAQEALTRTTNEKEFLEAHFLDLEKALEESCLAKQELERTRKEYEMLENHFLALEETSGQPSAHPQDGIKVPEHEKDIEELSLVEVASAYRKD